MFFFNNSSLFVGGAEMARSLWYRVVLSFSVSPPEVFLGIPGTDHEIP